ncbi:molybdenum cofactor guanylyltransferase MobA [Hyphomicrobium sp.]|jgi:molybdopterin-guanine dinucleotide biosynthesis protein A|uniref:molybdenum cofactor guanylyltransferase MobA n=1 Tax=Hyphomicrobium sp. TaxID=82 RepID=UPI00356A8187
MRTCDHILGVILAGGRSRRFGGGDKALADLNGQSILSRVIARFRPQVGRLVLNVNGDAARFAAYGIETISDRESPELGPLSGLLAAMDYAAEHTPGMTVIATVSADAPFVPDDLVARLDAVRNGGVAIAESAGRRHPTIGLWPMNARPAVADALARQALSANRLANDLNAVAVAFAMRDIDGCEIDPFFNINTRDDLGAARVLAKKTMEG